MYEISFQTSFYHDCINVKGKEERYRYDIRIKKLKKEFGHKLEKSTDIDPLFEDVIKDNVRFALLGEASHGT